MNSIYCLNLIIYSRVSKWSSDMYITIQYETNIYDTNVNL